MTSNQIAYAKQREEARANKESERIKSGELAEKKRSNRQQEKIGKVNIGANYLKAFGGMLPKFNDPSWYNGNPQLVKDVASFTYGQPLGMTTTITEGSGSTVSPSLVESGVPGVMVLKFVPTIGATTPDEANSINIAAKNIYSYVRHANSGHTNYEAVDLAMYLLAMDSAYTYYAYLTRVYSIAMTAKAENRYYGVAMLKAMGIDGENIISNLANFRAYINTYAMRLGAFNVPNVMPLFNRHIWMVSTIWKDSMIKRSQEYVFAPEYLYYYNDSTGSLVGTQITPAVGNTLNTVQSLITIGNSIINPLIASEDIGIMSGDILKAYGEASLFRVSGIDENYHIESQYSAEVLSQITAATLNGYLAQGMSSVTIKQTSNGLIYQGVLDDEGRGHIFFKGTRSATTASGGMFVSDKYRYINMYKDDVTPDDSMVATRLTTFRNTFTSTISSTVYSNLGDVVYCGSEILTTAVIAVLNCPFTSSTDHIGLYEVFDMQQVGTLTPTNQFSTTMLNTARQLAVYINAFDWAPRIRLFINTGNAEAIVAWDNMDWANYARLDSKNLQDLHSIAIYSEFAVEKLGTSRR